MVNSKGKGDASTSNSNSHTDDVANLTQTETTASCPMEMHVSGAEDKQENAIEEMNKLEDAMEESNNEENAKEEGEGGGGGGGGGEEEGGEGEGEEEDAMEVGQDEENANEKVIEEGEENSNEEEENEKDAIEGAENGENMIEAADNAAKEKNNKEKAKAKKKTTKLRRSRNKKNAHGQFEKAAGKGKDKDKPESSGKKKPSKKAESMGMIFMCSSKTKKDCYRYKVLGLPANKRDIVEKVYRGMRLFLFDFDLRLMYGIYKAAGPGGYNIEPKAFKSEFPAQVRFTILDDCSPLAEEKFKKIIKDNYYTRNKFDCQLNSEQVKNLCKLFTAANKGSKSRKLGRSRREKAHTFADRDRIRKQALDEERRSSRGGERRYHERPVIYEREPFASPVAALARVPPLPPAAPVPSYVYGRNLDTYGLQHRDHRFLDLEPRRGDDIEHRDAYISYRDPPLHRDPVYSAGLPPEYSRSAFPTSEHWPLAGLPPEYSHTASVASEYRTVAGPTSEYRTIARPTSEYRTVAVQPPYYRVAAAPQPTSEYRTVAVPQPEYEPHRSLYRY